MWPWTKVQKTPKGLKCQILEIEMYASSESWELNSIFENLESEGAKKNRNIEKIEYWEKLFKLSS